MTQTIETTDEQYLADYEVLTSERASEPAWLRDIRRQAIEAFKDVGFPVARKGNEDWKYTDIRPIARAAFQHPDGALPQADLDLTSLVPFDDGMSRIVFIDGGFAPHLSHRDAEGVTIETFADAIARDETLLRDHLTRFLEPRHGAFTALNTALFRDAAFIHIQGELAKPLHVVHVTGDHSNAVTYPRTLIVAGPLSRATVVESYVRLGAANHFTSAATEIELNEGANVDHYRLLLENRVSYHVAHLRADVGRDATFNSLAFTGGGGGLVRVDIEVKLGEPGGSTNLRGLYVTAGKQHVDHLVNIDHAAPHATSRLYYKGILDEESRAVFGGMVLVRQGADKTDSHQEDKNLLLSHDAEVDSKPSLEIYADDVKAGHGATAGAIADEALFYLRSRGIDEETAWQFLVRGFATEILDTVTIASLREFLEHRTIHALPRFHQPEAPA
jgi:Fe-S cluster assembly protein SufD